MAGLCCLGGLATADDRALLERLRIDHAAMVAAEQDFHAQRRSGALGDAETADYADYIARLHRRVAEGCAALITTGLAPPPGVACPSVSPPVLAPAAIDQAGERTPAEQVAALDAALQGGLGEFDEMLLREQQRVRAATAVTEAARGASAGAGAGQGAADQAGALDTAADSGEQRRPGRDATAAGGTQRRPAPPGSPPGIPDGSDDDVVARQLREAAEKEQDPELKRRLWEEYRRYKEGVRQGS